MMALLYKTVLIVEDMWVECLNEHFFTRGVLTNGLRCEMGLGLEDMGIEYLWKGYNGDSRSYWTIYWPSGISLYL